MHSPISTEIKESLHLTIPLASAQIAQAATGFVDTVMMGWLGQETLAGGGIAATTFTTLLVIATGIVIGVSPLIAEAYGAGNKLKIQQLTRQGIWLSLLLAIPGMLLLGQINRLMRFGLAENIVIIATTFLNTILWGFLPALMFAMFKSVVSSLSQPRVITLVVVIGTLFNAIGNYILGFGKLGFPALGVQGIAWASVLSNWLMLVLLIVYVCQDKQLKTYNFFEQLDGIDLKILRELVWLGVPIAISFAFEIGLFTTTTYLMGILGTDILAAHQIVFQTIAVIFMIPLGMSFATTIRVGQWMGQQNVAGAKRAAYVSMGMGGLFMTVMAIALLLFPRHIIALYLDIDNPENARAISLATSMLSIAAISQILDGVQTTAAGALRGLQDTRVPMLLSFLAFWGIGLTCGYLLGFRFGFGGVGLWWGQLIGVAVAAWLFVWRFLRVISSSRADAATS
ncbi:MATE family efflux transporter [Aliterella atlantica]|uniref:Probable multidrug resistance protein NorM n=1 Tax=Aliterella atlantica CENA595 TaxID=1618023 RepID=A0A0D8ZRJ2_9CYAN|nr:MATE family efflux transporter [Aliterella atlantica]KJH69811.1 multidrug transporter MatE [Aliterella atlantica CENA595]